MNPSVIREICGTESGYRKHRREDEKRCEECTVAHNEHRRKTYNTDKQRAHKEKYEEKVIKPARIARKKAQEEARAKKKAEALARKEERRQRGILYKQEKERRRIAHQEKLLAIAERKRIKREGIEQRKAEKALLREKKLLEAENNKRIAREERKQRSLERQARLAAEKEAKALEKAKKQEMLNNQHGVTVGDYTRCRKNNNGNACGLCKGVMNAYVSQKSKEPAYKDREKEWRKNNPHRRPHSNRERAIKRGVPTQYYTRQQIIDRDGTDCYLCHLPLDFEANHVQGQPGWELYPHVEHVVPLAKGGHDILDNVKLAHAKCNIDKGVELVKKATVWLFRPQLSCGRGGKSGFWLL